MLSHHLLTVLGLAAAASASVVKKGRTCYVYPEIPRYGETPDDTPSVLKAFSECGHDGSIVLPEGYTYHIGQVMNTTGLCNCDVNIYGEMIWSTDISYWLNHSIPVVYSSLSTAWLFGGENVELLGHNKGRFNGNGQLWYDENKGQGNQPGRPIAITFYNSTNLFVDGMTWHQPQFWNSFISHSQNVTMTNLFMNATSDDGNDTVNTDGTDTWNSKDIRLENWVVQNGDDCISVKGNSSNVYVNNITCYGSGAMPIGSVGSNPSTPDYVENILFENVVLYDSSNAAWIKTYQGSTTVPTINGGGYVKNVTWRNFKCNNVDQPIYVTQCIYNDDPAICDTSKVQISDITWQNITGTSRYNVAGSLHCSNEVPCPGLKFIDVHFESLNHSLGLPSPKEKYFCANIANQNTTANIPCGGYAPNNFPQQITSNYYTCRNGSVQTSCARS